MCFSAEADLVAGATVAVVGMDALRHVRRRRDVALASLPMLLAAHQLTEVVVWSDLHHRVPAVARGGPAVSLYALVAFVVVPALVPTAVLAAEPEEERRRMMVPFAVLGFLVAAAYAGAMGRRPVAAAISGHHISYQTGLKPGGTMAALYVAAVCFPLFASSSPRIVAFGACNAVAVVALLWLAQEELTSLWCAWAAVSSVVIAVHLRTADSPATSGKDAHEQARQAHRRRAIGPGACT